MHAHLQEVLVLRYIYPLLISLPSARLAELHLGAAISSVPTGTEVLLFCIRCLVTRSFHQGSIVEATKMMTMTELFYGPIEPTWIVHPQYYPVFKRPNGQINGENPYLVYADEAFAHRRSPYVQRNAVAAQDHRTPVPPALAGHGVMRPYQAQYFVHGANGTNNIALTRGGNQNQKHGLSPARAAHVLQPRNAMAIQTVHFMVPLCCDKCEDTVKEQLLDLDDVQRVTCDQWRQKVTVTSAIAPEKLLKRLQKIKKRTTFWPHQQSGRTIKVFNGNQVNGTQAQHQPQIIHQQKSTDDNETQVGSIDENTGSLPLLEV